MHVAVIGRGNVGGGLARKWERAGHTVTEIGRDGGDASAADVLLVAVPPNQITEALGRVGDVAGKVAIDATNVFGERQGGFPSNAEEVKSFTGGPVAKSFNMNYASLFDRVREQRVRPSNWYVADDGAVEVTETLIRDAGYDPVRVGDLSRARAFEHAVWLLLAATPPGGVFYRFAPPGEL